tara:strand:- start:9366 stop:10097 length:732 start_codon:yes stop_codon:yes gene_type:complete
MHKVCFIPARSQSKRLKGKNIRDLGGIPLVCWTIIFALKSKEFDQVIFSTDSDDYVRIVIEHLNVYNIDHSSLSCEIRDNRFCSDNTKIFDYLKNEFTNSALEKSGGLLVQMLPTSPFRVYGDLIKAIQLSQNNNVGIFSCTKYDFHVQFAFQINENNFLPLFDSSPMLTGATRSQDQSVYYHPTGNFYILDYKKLKHKMTTIYTDCRAYIVDKISSIDIDTLDDFNFAERFATIERNNLLKQ